MSVINIIAPIFILVGLGILLKNTGFVSERFFQECVKFTYWIALPALLFYKISHAEFDFTATWKISAAMICSSIIVALAAWGLASLLKLEGSIKKTFIQTSFHCNTAFVGLPVIVYVFRGGIGNSALIDAASVSLAPLTPSIGILSVIVMAVGNAANGEKKQTLSMIKNVFKNPLVIACLAGLAACMLKIKFPLAIERGFGALTPVALPLALLSIGASLKFNTVKEDFSISLTAACFNVIILPLVGLGLCRLLSLTAGETLIVLIFLACPTASSSYVYAQQLKGNPVFAGRVIVVSTILSVLPLITILLLWRSI